MRLGNKSETFWKQMKMNSQQPKMYGTQEGSPVREVHNDIGLPKKNRNISNKQPTPTSTRTGGTTKKTAHTKQKEGNNQDRRRIK